MKKFWSKFFNFKTSIFILFFAGATIIYAASQNADGIYEFNSGDAVSSNQINHNFTTLMNEIKALKTRVETLEKAVPKNTVAAFNLASCPETWVAADGGTYGDIVTPNLRGRFIRGLNNFGTGAQSTTSGDAAGVRSLRSYQSDLFKSHNHKPRYWYYDHDGNTPHMRSFVLEERLLDISHSAIGPEVRTTNSGGDETRPRNVSLIFCVKE